VSAGRSATGRDGGRASSGRSAARADGAPAPGLSMPPEWALHERTLMAWPARASLWGAALEAAREEYAACANAIAAFEPVLMVCAPGLGSEARARLAGAVEVVELPLDDSWLRDSGPIVVSDGAGDRAAVCFRFNAWGEKFLPYDADALVGERLAGWLGLPARRSDMVLEGGSIAVDGRGALLTTEQCLLNPNRNPSWGREEIERELVDQLGVSRIVWLGSGLVEDRDTDGHVDLIAAFLPSGEVLLQQVPEDDPNFANCEENAARLREAGFAVRPMPFLARTAVEDEPVVLSYMNHYVCNGGVIVPLAGQPVVDEGALEVLARAYPDHEVVGVPGLTIAYGGGGPHCITQQVPAR
jgi:agmatine deiminase